LQLRRADSFAGRPQHAQRFWRQLSEPGEAPGSREVADVDKFQSRWPPVDCVMPKQVDQRQLIGDVVFEPEHDALIICGAVELALLVFKASELSLVFQRRVELITVAIDDVACTLLEIS
jgi:hypothetical protein